MSQTNASNETCKECRKPWLTHHTLAGVSPEGKVSISCHDTPVEKTDFVLKYVLESRAAKKAAEAELESFKKKVALDRQAAEAELGRKHASAVEAAVASKLAAEVEATRVQCDAGWQAKIADLKGQLKDAESISEQLVKDVSAAKAKIAAGESRSIELQLEVERLGQELEQERLHHEGLKIKSKDLVHLAMTMGKRVVVLERKLGTDGTDVDVDAVYGRLLDAPPPRIEKLERIVLEEAAKTVPQRPVAAPPPAPKAEAKPRATVVLDDEPSAPEAEGEDGSDDEADAHPVGDHEVISQDEVPDAADEESEEEGPKTCNVCGHHPPAVEVLSFIHKDAAPGDEKLELYTCDAAKHAAKFFAFLKENAKYPPKTVADVIALFNPII